MDRRYGDPDRVGDQKDSTRTRLDGLEGKALAPAADDKIGVPGRCCSKTLTRGATDPDVYGLVILSNPSATGMPIAGISLIYAAAITSVLENAACRTSAKHSRCNDSASTSAKTCSWICASPALRDLHHGGTAA